jgi:hypothetical protein
MKRKQKRNNKIAPFIITFCNEISNETPVLVPLRPIPGKPHNECFNVVPEHIIMNGGKERYGWCIHIWKRVLIEAEFHCVWENPAGKLFDLTPKTEKGNFIIFLPAPDKKYEGRQVENIRKPLSRDKDIRILIKLWGEYFRYLNQGDLAGQYGMITIRDEGFSRVADQLVETEMVLKSRYGNQRTLTA